MLVEQEVKRRMFERRVRKEREQQVDLERERADHAQELARIRNEHRREMQRLRQRYETRWVKEEVTVGLFRGMAASCFIG